MRTTLLVAALAAIGCGAAITTPSEVGGPHRRVLFVGNSLTYTNALPATVAAIATNAGDEMTVSMAAEPNLALIDHLTGSSDAVQQLKNNNWDVVVLQQGPTSAAGICRDSMILWTKMFDAVIKPSGAKTALFMTWPAVSQGDVWAGVRTSYQNSAEAVGGIFLPAGEAWHLALADHPGLPLYSEDRFHPSAMGSYLAALEIYERLSGKDARTLPLQAFSEGRAIPMGSDTIRWLQQAAHKANSDYPALSGALVAHPASFIRPPLATSC